MEKTKVLITGVAGLIGSHFSRYLLDLGYEVYGIDDLSGGYRDYIDPRVKFYEFDLLDQAKLEQVFQEVKPQYVYHFAAYAAEGLSPFIRNFNYSNNVLASVNIINNCIEYGAKLIFTSSMAVYGEQELPFKETQTPQPVDPYGIAKYAVELDIKQAADQFGLKYTIVRPHNIIGIYQNIWDKYRNVIGIWIRRVLEGETICIFGDGKQRRAFSDIKFYMEPFAKLMTEGNGETYNLGADQDFQLADVAVLVREIAREHGYNPRIEHLEARHEVKEAYCDHAEAKTDLDFKDGTDLRATIEEMFRWAKEQPSREVRKMDYEINKNMYEFWK